MGFCCVWLGGGVMDGEIFLIWMCGMLVKEFKFGDVVVMDNLFVYKGLCV